MVVANSVHRYERVAMPELLAGLTDRNNEIILGYREKSGDDLPPPSNRKTAQHKPSYSCGEGAEDGEDDADLDLTGSPLGADFDPHQKWNLSCPDLEDGDEVRPRAGPQYAGVSLARARGWLSERGGPEECWAVTDGEDKERTVYLGSRLEDSTMTLSRVSVQPPASSKVISGQLGRVLSGHSSAGAGARSVRHLARSELSLVGGAGAGGGEGSSIRVVSAWSKVSSLLERPPVDADTRLEVTVVAGDSKLDTAQLWTELQLLAGFVRGLAGEGVTWLGGEEELHTETLVADIIDTVRQLGPRSGVTKLEADTMVDTQDMEPFSFKARQEVDFTDILWSHLYRVQSYQQLTEAFKLIFATIIKEEIRPFIYARNKTKSVVQLVSGIVRGGEVVPDLSGSLPLEMLIECGLEKLQRDYSHTLLNSELASKENIAQFLVTSGDLQAASQRLHSLHLVVELAVLLETHTKLPSDILRSIVGTALSSAGADSAELKRSYEFPVPTQSLENLFVQSPDVWQLKLSTGKTCNLSLSLPTFTICCVCRCEGQLHVPGRDERGEDRPPQLRRGGRAPVCDVCQQ